MLGWVILGARERIDVRAWGLGSASPCWWLNRLRLAQLADPAVLRLTASVGE